MESSRVGRGEELRRRSCVVVRMDYGVWMWIVMGRLAVPSVDHAQVQRLWVSVRSGPQAWLLGPEDRRSQALAGTSKVWKHSPPLRVGPPNTVLYFVRRVIGIDRTDRV